MGGIGTLVLLIVPSLYYYFYYFLTSSLYLYSVKVLIWNALHSSPSVFILIVSSWTIREVFPYPFRALCKGLLCNVGL